MPVLPGISGLPQAMEQLTDEDTAINGEVAAKVLLHPPAGEPLKPGEEVFDFNNQGPPKIINVTVEEEEKDDGIDREDN